MSVKEGDQVAVEYEGTYEDGEVFDSSNHGEHSHPLVFVVGSGQIIKGFDDAVRGMNTGEEKKIRIPANEAYGEYDSKLTQDIPRSELQLPRNQQPKEGMTLVMQTPEGQIPVRVSAVSATHITLDMNHPLAGKTLLFTIKLVGIGDEAVRQVSMHQHSH